MILDTPGWVCHRHVEGITALDVAPNGRRLVTCGTEPQIMVWSTVPLLDAAAEADTSAPKLLATLSEHQGSVLVARFSRSGRLLASGGNDNAVLLYRLAPGPGGPRLGCRYASTENWRTTGALRGHSLDVTDLAWAPGDSMLATASMDGTVLVYSVTADGAGSLLHSIRGAHHGWVKGLAFDPLGRYLASQGRNGVKVWDISADWAAAGHVRGPYERAPEAAFRFRVSWSPDGESLLTVGASSGRQPTLCALTRQSWTVTHLVGHRSSVVAAAANPRLFRLPRRIAAARRSEAAARAARDPPSADGAGAGGDGGEAREQQQEEGYEDAPCMIMAAGSNDRTLSVWASELSLPLLHVTQLHGGPVIDVAWGPDGYTLYAASSDDSVSVIRFSEAELGVALTDAEFSRLLREEYGDAAAAAATGATGMPVLANGGRAPSAALRIEDATLARLAAGATRLAAEEPAVEPAVAAAAAAAPLAVAAASAAAPLAAPLVARAPAAASVPRRLVPQPLSAPSSGAGAGSGGGGGALERRLMPSGGGATEGSLLSSLPRSVSGAASGGASKRSAAPLAAAVPAPATKRSAVPLGAAQQQLQQPLAARQLALPAAAAAAAACGVGQWPLPAPPLLSRLEVEVAQLPGPPDEPSPQALVLVVDNAPQGGRTGSNAAAAAIALHWGGGGGECLWRDAVAGGVVCAAGSAYYSAAATASGLLHTWRTGGSMLLPPLALGCPPAHMTAQGSWELLLVGADGQLTLLDLQQGMRRLGAAPPPSLLPPLAASPPGTRLHDAWARRGPGSSTAPMAVLSDGSGWMLNGDLGLWMCLQPGAGHPAGAAPRPGGVALSGDAERLRSGSAAALSAGPPPRLALPGPDAPLWRRKEAEMQLQRCLWLGDAAGYERWLGLLAHLLATQRDQNRLRELAQDLLGPERWTPTAASSSAWSPSVLGLTKRDLLARLLVPAAAAEGLAMARWIHSALQAANAYAAAAGTDQPEQQVCGGLSPPLLGIGPPAGQQQQQQAAVEQLIVPQQQQQHLLQAASENVRCVGPTNHGQQQLLQEQQDPSPLGSTAAGCNDPDSALPRLAMPLQDSNGGVRRQQRAAAPPDKPSSRPTSADLAAAESGSPCAG